MWFTPLHLLLGYSFVSAGIISAGLDRRSTGNSPGKLTDPYHNTAMQQDMNLFSHSILLCIGQQGLRDWSKADNPFEARPPMYAEKTPTDWVHIHNNRYIERRVNEAAGGITELPVHRDWATCMIEEVNDIIQRLFFLWLFTHYLPSILVFLSYTSYSNIIWSC